MTTPAVTSVRCRIPPGWVVWAAGDGASTADTLVAANASPTAGALAAAVRTFDDDTLASHPGTQLAGLWQPDDRAAPVASLRILLTSPGSARMTRDELLAFAQEPPPDVETLDVVAEPGNLAAGPAVAQIVRAVHRPPTRGARMVSRLLGSSGRQVITHVTWFVLPPGTDQVVTCRFETSNPYLLDALGQETNLITDTLVVDLEAP